MPHAFDGGTEIKSLCKACGETRYAPDHVVDELINARLAAGKDALEICHELKLKRFELGNLGFGTGPWTAEAWDEECRRRGYQELVYGEAPQ